MRYKKIRGQRRKVIKIQNWVKGYSMLDVEWLLRSEYGYVKVTVQPWRNLTLTNSQIPEPKGEAKKKIIKGLGEIYSACKTELDNLGKPYYLKIWLYEPRLSMSQVVYALDEKAEYYRGMFEEGSFKEKEDSFTNGLSPSFSWESMIDEDVYLESRLLWEIDQGWDYEGGASPRKLLNKLKKGSYRSQKVDGEGGNKDTVYFLPKGKVWVGELR